METTVEKPSKKKTGEKILNFITNSAPFALLLSVVFFAVEFYKNDKEFDETIKGLKTIEQSLSTRHIGIFPDYLDEINKLLAETPRSTKDTAKIIIFEDVLFYGAFYNGNAFKEMIQQLTELSNKGKKIIIAYYDNNKEWRRGRMFREVVQESWMRQADLSKLVQERSEIVESLQKGNTGGANLLNLLKADSIASEKYFACYRDDKQGDFSRRRDKIRRFSFYDATKNDNLLFDRIDKIKNVCMNKPENSITFNDIYTMYDQITEQLKSFFYQHNIKTIPLDNYLAMSCWSNGEKVLFAFPGRFAADEIGFISHDPAILYYIATMLYGVENISR